MIYEVTIGETVRKVSVEKADGLYAVQVDDGPERRVEARKLGQVLSMLVDDRSVEAGLARREGGWDVSILGTTHDCAVVDPRRKALRLAGGAGNGALKASMPGRIISVLVEPEQVVTKGQPVMVIEAMKMENELKAPIDGRVAEVLVQPGQAVESGAALMKIVADE
jgi:biotin carboxyl carrier protein